MLLKHLGSGRRTFPAIFNLLNNKVDAYQKTVSRSVRGIVSKHGEAVRAYPRRFQKAVMWDMENGGRISVPIAKAVYVWEMMGTDQSRFHAF